MRRLDFTHRYGYAPDMLDAAEQAFVFYDPYVTLDAAHAAMFTRSNVKKFRMPHMGSRLQSHMAGMRILLPTIRAAADNNLTTRKFAKLMRARRENRTYLYDMMLKLDANGRHDLTKMLCTHVTRDGKRAPRFEKRLAQLNKQEAPKD
jgi:hypothetical protein